jgi:CTP synthase
VEAGHREADPETTTPLLVLAYCSIDSQSPGTIRLSGKLKIKVIPGSLAWQIYQKPEVEEPFNCNYELNQEYRSRLESTGLKVSGESETGRARIIELPDNRSIWLPDSCRS